MGKTFHCSGVHVLVSQILKSDDGVAARMKAPLLRAVYDDEEDQDIKWTPPPPKRLDFKL